MNAKKNVSKRWLLTIPVVFLMLFVMVLLVIRMEGEAPTMKLDLASPSLGASQTLSLEIADGKSGIREVWVGLLKDGEEIELLDKAFPPAGLFKGGAVTKNTVQFDFEPKAKGVTDGKAILRMVVRDFSWRHLGKGNAVYQEQEVIIDTRPPVINVLSRAHYLSQGGAGLVIYTLSEECPTHGVSVGDHFFPGSIGYADDPKIYAAMIAVDYRQGPGTPVVVTATDFAGNENRAGIQHRINARQFKNDRINISDNFLDWKMPEFVTQVDAAPDDSNLDIFLKVNGGLRRANYESIKKATRQSDSTIHWSGPFLRLPAAANRAGFADHRSYYYNGKKIDEQTHLGIDLASLAHSEIPAANAGKVVFAESLGIYGQAIIIDHGGGLFSLYSHLSAIGVSKGQMVAKGDIIGNTGRTGLAGGDHLHFSMLVHHTFVNPLQWWDENWIANNIGSKIKDIKKAS